MLEREDVCLVFSLLGSWFVRRSHTLGMKRKAGGCTLNGIVCGQTQSRRPSQEAFTNVRVTPRKHYSPSRDSSSHDTTHERTYELLREYRESTKINKNFVSMRACPYVYLLASRTRIVVHLDSNSRTQDFSK